jgi:Protein of unknown function (DUF4232)
MKTSVRIAAAVSALVLGATLATSATSQAQSDPRGRTAADCTGRQLDVELGRLGAAAGSKYQVIRFTNLGLRRCVLHGHPKVSHRGKHHKLIGKPARWIGGSGDTFVLRPGRTAKTTLQIPSWANFPAKDCHAKIAPRLRVVPPGTNRKVGFRYPEKVCTTRKGRDSVQAIHLSRP